MSPEQLRQKYLKLREEWEEGTATISSLTIQMEHPAFQEILQLGPDVIPFILEDIQHEASWIIIALPILAGERPTIRPEDAGRLSILVASWLEWGQAKGYLQK